MASVFPMLEREYRHFVVLLGEVLDESCGNNVEDELALEIDDHPWKNNKNKMFRIAQNFPILGQMELLTAGSLVGVTVFFAELA